MAREPELMLTGMVKYSQSEGKECKILISGEQSIVLSDMLIEVATVNDAKEILQSQRLAHQSEAAIYNEYTIPPLTQKRGRKIYTWEGFSRISEDNCISFFYKGWFKGAFSLL